jgi:hypothetical protein
MVSSCCAGVARADLDTPEEIATSVDLERGLERLAREGPSFYWASAPREQRELWEKLVRQFGPKSDGAAGPGAGKKSEGFGG